MEGKCNLVSVEVIIDNESRCAVVIM